jgi:hypothetical protein
LAVISYQLSVISKRVVPEFSEINRAATVRSCEKIKSQAEGLLHKIGKRSAFSVAADFFVFQGAALN